MILLENHTLDNVASEVAGVDGGLPASPNPDAARRTTASDEKAMADCIDTSQAPLPPLSLVSSP